MILFSIIVPTYNGAKIITPTIKSILSQAYHNWELIIVDDGSTDNTEEISKPFQSDSRVQFYKKQNEGVAAARNFGAAMSKGEFLIFIDNDDYATPGMLQAYHKLVSRETQTGIAFASRIETDTNKIVPPKNGGYFLQNVKKSVAAGTYCVENSVFQAVQGFDERLKQSENWELMIRLVDYCKKHKLEMVATEEIVLHYNRFFTNDKFQKRMNDRIQANQIIFEKYRAAKLFSKSRLIDFSDKIAKLSMENGNKQEALKWQTISIKTAPFYYKPYLKLLKYIFSGKK